MKQFYNTKCSSSRDVVKIEFNECECGVDSCFTVGYRYLVVGCLGKQIRVLPLKEVSRYRMRRNSSMDFIRPEQFLHANKFYIICYGGAMTVDIEMIVEQIDVIIDIEKYKCITDNLIRSVSIHFNLNDSKKA